MLYNILTGPLLRNHWEWSVNGEKIYTKADDNVTFREQPWISTSALSFILVMLENYLTSVYLNFFNFRKKKPVSLALRWVSNKMHTKQWICIFIEKKITQRLTGFLELNMPPAVNQKRCVWFKILKIYFKGSHSFSVSISLSHLPLFLAVSYSLPILFYSYSILFFH